MIDRVPLLVSVVIPSYNHAQYLGRALQSILDQTYTNWEAIVIDNHSTDHTDEVMGNFTDQRITYLKIHNNGIIAASRNVSIQTAKGEWIAFLDSDDWWSPDKLQVCLDCINDKVDLIYHDMEIVTDKKKSFRRKIIKSWQVRTPVLVDLLLRGNALVNSSVVVRKTILQKLNGINESYKMIAAEDYNTWLRIAQLTDHFVYMPRRLGYYLNHNQSISKKNMSMSARAAVEEFLPILKPTQKLKLEVNLRYISLRYNYLKYKYSDIKDNFKFILRHGNVVQKIKALILLILIIKKGIEEVDKSK
jgi:glycosyltransferase involved in cell wall biosynthesis